MWWRPRCLLAEHHLRWWKPLSRIPHTGGIIFRVRCKNSWILFLKTSFSLSTSLGFSSTPPIHPARSNLFDRCILAFVWAVGGCSPVLECFCVQDLMCVPSWVCVRVTKNGNKQVYMHTRKVIGKQVLPFEYVSGIDCCCLELLYSSGTFLIFHQVHLGFCHTFITERYWESINFHEKNGTF